MNRAPGRPQLQTLGERILSLSSGDPCPCCGARLEAGRDPALRRAEVLTGPSSVARLPVSTESQTDRACTQGLACPECGCEIDDVEPDEAAFMLGGAALGALCPAA